MRYGPSPRDAAATTGLLLGAATLAVALFVLQVAAVVAEEAGDPMSTTPIEGTTQEGTAAPAAEEQTATRAEIDRLNATIKDKKAEIDGIQKQIEGYNQKIGETRGKVADIQSEIELLQNKLKKTELDLKQTQAEIDTANLEIRTLDLEVKDKTARIADRKAVVEEYLRTIYRYDDRSELEVLLANDSFSEFFDQIKYLEETERLLAKNLAALIVLKQDLETERGRKEAKKTVLAELQRRLDRAKEDLETTQGAKLVLVDEAQQSEASLRRSLQQLRNEQANIEADLQSIEAALKERLRKNDKFASLPGEVVLSWPVDPSRGITTYFHDPDYPFRYVFEHPGLDIRAAQGTPVRSSAAGFVARARDGGMGYSYVMVVHSEGVSTVYGHLSRIVVGEDEFVERGQLIGFSGGMPGTPGAGRLTTGPHLHFEVRSDGIPVNPLDYLMR